jgi:hypothetical protein
VQSIRVTIRSSILRLSGASFSERSALAAGITVRSLRKREQVETKADERKNRNCSRPKAEQSNADRLEVLLNGESNYQTKDSVG